MNWLLLQNSLLVSVATTLLALGFGFTGALGLASLGPRWRHSLLALTVVALALPSFLVTNGWLDLLGQNGRWRFWFPFNIFSLGGTVWILALLLWPLTSLLVLSAWNALDPSQLETDPGLRGAWFASALLWPAAEPALKLATVLTAVISFNNFAVPAILQTKVFPAELWVSFNTTYNYTAVLLLSWPLLAVGVIPLIFLRSGGVAWPRLNGRVSPALFRRHLGSTGFVISCLSLAALLGLSVLLPLADLVISSRTWSELPGAFAAGKTAIWNTVLFAALTATVCTVGSVSLWRCRFLSGLWMLFFLPGVLLGIALIYLLNHSWSAAFYPGAAMVIGALSLRYFVMQWTGARQAMLNVDLDLKAAAQVDGLRGWNLFRHMALPQIAPTLAAGWYVTFLLCLGDVETVLLIIPPGGETLGVRIFNLLHYGHNAQVNALCLILLALALAPLGLWTACKLIQQSRLGEWLRGGASVRTVAVLGLVVLAGCGGDPDNGVRLPTSKLFHEVQVIGTWGTAPGQFNKPRSLTLDADDNLYVVDMTGRVQKFSKDGTFVAFWQMPETDIGKPKGMCRDASGDIVVIEPHYARVNHFRTDGTLAHQWGTTGTNAGQLTIPRAAAVNSKGEIFITEYTRVDRMQKFSHHGTNHLIEIGQAGNGTGEFNRPEGVGIGRDDHVYVADSCNHRIQVFNSDGNFFRAHGKAGSGSGEFSYPYDVQIDAQGFEFVCEFGNSRIQIFDADGRVVEILGQAGQRPGEFHNPWSIALDSAGNLYVADSKNNRVQKFVRKREAGYSTVVKTR